MVLPSLATSTKLLGTAEPIESISRAIAVLPSARLRVR